MYRNLLFSLLLSCALAAVCMAGPRGQDQGNKSSAAQVASLLEKAGYNYTKVDQGVWEILFKGKNVAQFPVRIAVADDLVISIAKLADPKELKTPAQLYPILLRLNDKMDSVKFALSDEMLYIRMEMHLRVLDDTELKYMLDQISAAVEESYPEIKNFLNGAK